jgi:hypothetical protein
VSGFSIGSPNRLLVTEEGHIAVVSIDLIVEPTVDDDAIFGLRDELLNEELFD